MIHKPPPPPPPNVIPMINMCLSITILTWAKTLCSNSASAWWLYETSNCLITDSMLLETRNALGRQRFPVCCSIPGAYTADTKLAQATAILTSRPNPPPPPPPRHYDAKHLEMPPKLFVCFTVGCIVQSQWSNVRMTQGNKVIATWCLASQVGSWMERPGWSDCKLFSNVCMNIVTKFIETTSVDLYLCYKSRWPDSDPPCLGSKT